MVTHHLENFTAQGHGVHHSAFRGEKCAIRVKQLVGAQKIVTEQGFVEKAFLEPCGVKLLIGIPSFLWWRLFHVAHGFSQQVDKRPFCVSIKDHLITLISLRHGWKMVNLHFPAVLPAWLSCPLPAAFSGSPSGGHRRVSHADGHAVFKVQRAKRQQKAVTKQTSPAFAFSGRSC